MKVWCIKNLETDEVVASCNKKAVMYFKRIWKGQRMIFSSTKLADYIESYRRDYR